MCRRFTAQILILIPLAHALDTPFFVIVAATGNIYSGVWYPIAVAG